MNIHLRINELLHEKGNFVLVAVVSAKGHVPQEIGAKMLVTNSGIDFGTIGGGKVEARAIQLALELLQNSNQRFHLVNWNLQTDLGMSCGGEMGILFEVYNQPKWNVVVFGAGHVAQALVRLLLEMSVSVTCVDTRVEWLDRLPRSALLKPKCVEKYEDGVAEIQEMSFCVVVTQGHSTDFPVLKSILNLEAPPVYIGAIGSKIKAKRLKQELGALFSKDTVGKLNCPIGLELGPTHNCTEIAVSIAAEIIQRRNRIAQLNLNEQNSQIRDLSI